MNTHDLYKLSLINCLKEKYKININENSLTSILSPTEFMQIINEFTSEDFTVGKPSSSDNKEFFKNVIDGKFRITLHNHTDFSDGRMTPEDFINQAAQYANKVAKKISKNDSRPPFVIALTDHDNIEGCQEIIKIIVQNPEKYKNLKFVAGVELGAEMDNYYFDLTALVINPFNEELNDFIDKQKYERTQTINELISKINNLTGSDFNLEQLEKIGFKGKKTLINKSGLIYIEDSKNIMLKLLKEIYGENNDYEKSIISLYKDGNYARRDIPKVNDVLKVVKISNGVTSWTHPLRSFKREDNLDFHKNFLEKLQRLGVNGVEVNHQYSYKQLNEIKYTKEKNELYKEVAKKYNMFLSGGTDSHEENIFAHHQIIDDKLLDQFLN